MTFVSSSSAQQVAFSGTTISSDTLVIPAPAGVAVGDFLVAGINTEAFVTGQSTNVKADDLSWNRVLTSSNVTIFWKVATSTPASYTFHSFLGSGTTPWNAFMDGIMGCWTGWTGPVRKTLVTDSGNKSAFAQNLVIPPASPPHVIDIPSLTLQDVTAPIETTTGGLLVTFFDILEGIENFDGTFADNGNPTYPATVPYADATVSGPDIQHEQIYYAGTPRAGEYVGGIGTTYRAGNDELTMASQELAAGDVPGTTATFTWQHAGAEAGFGEAVWGVRLLLEATAIARAYWGIDAILQ